MDNVYHYPPELMQLMIDALPRLCRSKNDLLLFFKGAGVPDFYTKDFAQQIRLNRDAVKKHNMVRIILERLNDSGEKSLRERREVLKRVVEWEDYSTCWPEDELKAKGLVSEIRRVVEVKDSFTRMRQEKDFEKEKRQTEQKARLENEQRKKQEFEGIRHDLGLLFTEENPNKRGKNLEIILNKLFKASGVLVKESFTLNDYHSGVTLEQVDGAIELDGHIYLVEMKWHKEPIGVELVTNHLSRLYTRDGARGIVISASKYTFPAVEACRAALSQKTVVLCTLQEIVMLLERHSDLKDFLREKTRIAIIEKNPFHEII